MKSTILLLFALFLGNSTSLALVTRHNPDANILVNREMRANDTVSGEHVEALLPAQCPNPPRGQCEFYRDCLEARFHCQATGYPLGYGEKYCLAFTQASDTFSPLGKTWILDTMQCLQNKLVPDYTGVGGTPLGPNQCTALSTKAFATHADCYVNSGVCKLPLLDWYKIMNVVGIRTLITDWRGWKEAAKTALACTAYAGFINKEAKDINA